MKHNDLLTMFHRAIRDTFHDRAIKDAPEGPCSCGSDDWLIVEHGIDRACRTKRYDGTFVATQQGWDDYSEESVLIVLVCAECDTVYDCPNSLDWE